MPCPFRTNRCICLPMKNCIGGSRSVPVAPPSAENPPRRHQDLVDVLVTGDVATVAEAMRQHVNLSLENTMERLKPYFRLRKTYGKTFFRSDKRQKLELVDLPVVN